jgi:hypothetical protein
VRIPFISERKPPNPRDVGCFFQTPLQVFYGKVLPK